MENHIKFNLGEQKRFIQAVMIGSGLPLDKIAKIAGTVPRNFRDWRREKITMTLPAALEFEKRFGVHLPENREIMETRWLEERKQRNRVGGLARFRKYGSLATPEGCRKGGLNSIIKRYNSLLKPFDRPKLSQQLAEFFGVLLGDGGLTKDQWFITVNSVEDYDYSLFLTNLTRELFNFVPSVRKRSDCNAIVISGSGKKSIEFFTKFGLKIGNKVKQQVDVPNWIKNDRTFSIACLRGLIDTDGGVFLHRYKVNGKQYTYKKVCFSNRSLPLLKFVLNTLLELGFNPKSIFKVENKKVWLYNKDETERYLEVVGTHNARLLKHQSLGGVR